MSIFQYLQPQIIDPQDDGTTSDLDEYTHDEVINLDEESEGEDILHAWEAIEQDMHETVATK